MILHNQYVPVLKWRQGEYMALSRLKNQLKESIVPLIIIPPIEFDFEEECPKLTIDEHLEKFASRLKLKWGSRLALIDMESSLHNEVMNTNEIPIQFILRTLKEQSCTYTPVLSLDKNTDYLNAVKDHLKDSNGVALRLSLADLAQPEINANIASLLSHLQIDLNLVDLIVDLQKPDTFMPYSDFGHLVSYYIKSISRVIEFRSLVITATSLNLKEVNKPGGEYDRHEWIFYKSLINNYFNEDLIPTFGDYSIETPFFQKMDFRIMNPAGKVVYTCDESWLITKGGSFRNNNSQMEDHCKKIRSSMHFCGPSYSWGDKKINEVADNKTGKFGNLGTWKQAGVSHHLTKVTNQVSSFFSP